MTPEITAGFGALQTAYDMTKALVSLRDVTVFQAKALELQRQILAAQEYALAANAAQSALLERVRDLEKQIADAEAWQTEREKYELDPLGQVGTFAYALKREHCPPTGGHYICPNCYEDRRKSILQQEFHAFKSLVCPRCKLIVRAQ